MSGHQRAMCITGGERGGDALFISCALERGDQVEVVTFPGRSLRLGKSVKVNVIPMRKSLTNAQKYTSRIYSMMDYNPTAMYAIAHVPSNNQPLLGGTGETVRVFRESFPHRPIYIYNYTGNTSDSWWTIDHIPKDMESNWPWVHMIDPPPSPSGTYLAAGTTSVKFSSDDNVVKSLRELYGM